MKYIYAAAVITLIIATFFITREIYKQDPPKLPPAKIEYVTKEVPPPPPIILQGHIDTVDLSKEDPIIADAQIDSSKDSTRSVIASDTVRIVAEGDTLNLETKYYFPPINKFKHTVLKYKKTDKKITEYVPIYQELGTTFWKRLKFGVGVGAAVYQDDHIKIKPAIIAGLFYYF